MKFPSWVNTPGLTYKEVRTNELSFLLKNAALHHNSTGTLEPLADDIGFTRQAIYKAISNGFMSAGMACAIETAVGSEVAPRHLLCPEKYTK